MALSKSQKQGIVKEVQDLIDQSKMTVVARYQGIDVKSLQGLRHDAKENGTKVKIIKNRLVLKALKSQDKFKDLDTSAFEGMLLYAFNGNDEVAAAQTLNKFAKTNDNLQFVGAINSEGKFVEASEVKALASLPSKELLLATILNTLASPMQNITSGLSGNLHNILRGLEAKASN